MVSVELEELRLEEAKLLAKVPTPKTQKLAEKQKFNDANSIRNFIRSYFFGGHCDVPWIDDLGSAFPRSAITYGALLENKRSSRFRRFLLSFFLFATFHNPKGYDVETGFYLGASDKIADMLLFRNIADTSDDNEAVSRTMPSGKETVG